MANLPTELQQLFSFIDCKKREYINNLKTAVEIQSVSAWPEKRDEITRMVDWTAEKLRSLGVDVTLEDVGIQKLHDGRELPLPKVIFGTLGKSLKKKTVLVYGHLDVQPALKEDGWNTEPFVLTEIDGKMFGRGASDDKGPVLCWLHAIEAYQQLKIDLPVNIKFVFEGMEESGSEGLDELLLAHKDDFLSDVDYVCISDNYWLGRKRPCLTYGLRGLVYFSVEVECASKDLHSGVYGGTVSEAMPDLCYLLNSLVGSNAQILVPGIMRDVAIESSAEYEIYEKIDFEIDDYKKEIGTEKLAHGNKTDVLMARWRYPSLSIHGIEGAFYEPGAKTVIPKKVIGKFSIRLVPDQDPEHIAQCVTKHLKEEWSKRNSPNKMKVIVHSSGKPWTEDPKHPHYEAAKRAVKHVFNVEPDMTREGGSIPVTLTLQEATGKNVILVPIGACDDGAHSQNEKLDIYNYIEGTKLLSAYIHEVGKL